MGWFAFGILTRVFAVKARFEIDEEQTKLMQARWEGRNHKAGSRTTARDRIRCCSNTQSCKFLAKWAEKAPSCERFAWRWPVRKAAKARLRQHRQARNGH